MATRHERVVVALQDDLSAGMLKMAGATALLNRELNRLSGQSVTTSRGTAQMTRDIDGMGSAAKRTESQIDKLSGRVRILADVAAVLGPSLIPLGGVGLAGIAGLSAQLGFAAVAGGVLIGSLSGLGDALKAMTKAGVEPTAENMGKLSEEMGKLAPQTQDFVTQIYGVMPALKALREVGRGSMIPGLGEALVELEVILPKIAAIMDSVGSEMGDIIADVAGSFASDRWSDFFTFLEVETPTAIRNLSTIVGDLAHGMAELWMAFTPLNNDFSSWMVGVANSFDQWAAGLSQTQGFQEFIDYVRTSGPQVADTLAALGNAMVQIVQAAAPLGGPVLAGIEAFAKAIGAIADSDLGTPIMLAVGAMALLSRATAAYGAVAKMSFGGAALAPVQGFVSSLASVTTAQERATTAAGALNRRQTELRAGMATLGKSAALVGGLAVASTGAADGLGLTNTASLALMGAWGGAPGIAIGAGAGLLLDLKAAGDQSADAIEALNAAVHGTDLGALDAQIAAMEKSVADLTNTTSVADFFGDFMEGPGVAGRTDAEIAALKAAKAARVDLASTTEQVSRSTSYRDMLAAQTAALDHNVESMRMMREETLRAESAQLNYKSALLDAKDAIKENGKTLDTNTRAGIDNRSKLLGMAAAWNGLDGTIKGAAGAHRRAIDAFVAVAVQMGMGKKAARDYARSLYEIPERVETKIDIDTNPARGEIAKLRAELNNIPDETVAVRVVRGNVVTGSMGGPRYDNAYGNVFDRANMHQPEWATGKVMRVWNEPETQGESYIPHANDARRPRAKSLVEATAHKFGGEVAWYAGGGMRNGKGSGKVGSADERLAVLQAEQSIRELLKSLKADGKDKLGKNAREIAKVELEAARAQLKAAKAGLGQGGRDKASEAQLAAAGIQKDAAETAKQTAETERDRIKALRDSAVSSTMSNALGGGLDFSNLGAFDKSLTGQANNAEGFKQALAALTGMGLDGGLLEEVGKSGSLKFANQLQGAGPGGIDYYEGLYAQANTSAMGAGNIVGDTNYGAAQAAAQASFDQMSAQLAEHTRLLEKLNGTTAAAPAATGGFFGATLNSTTKRAAQKNSGRKSNAGKW